jgi:hypothetical protein
VPRRNYPAKTRRARKAAASEAEVPQVPNLPITPPPGWEVRAIAAPNAVKQYRCPGCNHEIRPRTAHLVAWRIGDEGHRRHWHQGCFKTHLRSRRA